MKKKIKFLLIPLVLVLAASTGLLATGCSNPTVELSEIAGDWRVERYHHNQEDMLVFFSNITINLDGTFSSTGGTTVGDNAVSSAIGIISITGGNRIRFDSNQPVIDNFFNQLTYRILFEEDGNRMIWRWSSMGSRAEYILARV